MHVRFEYGYDKNIEGLEYIFRMENQRGDGVWDANFARPQIERFAASSPYITGLGVMNGLAYLSFEFGISTSADPGNPVYMGHIERITPGYAELFGFDFIAGSGHCLGEPGHVIISQSIADKLFGNEDPIGRQVFFSEFRNLGETLNISGMTFDISNTVGGVYRDFPENTRLRNVVYGAIEEGEMMDDWYTGSYYAYVRLSSPERADEICARYMAENEESLRHTDIFDVRHKPVGDLYFGEYVRWDSVPQGNKLTTDMLLLTAFLIIAITLVNYVNFSVALAPVRIKSVTTRKVLGCSQSSLRRSLILESVWISLTAFIFALILVALLSENGTITGIFGHSLSPGSNKVVVIWTALLAVATGTAAGIYPALYMTSFPPAMAINGSYSLTGRARATRKLLVVFQYAISIMLIIGSLFITIQNRYIRNVELGFDRNRILEVRLSFSSAYQNNRLYSELLMRHPDIKGVAFNEHKLVTDESRTSIGYHYSGAHSYIQWIGASPGLPEVMGIEIIAGRAFRPDDEQPESERAVCIINQTAAMELMSLLPDEITDINQFVGTTLRDGGTDVEIIGISRDFHFESLYRPVKPFGFWVSPKGKYRRYMPENFSYIRIAGKDPDAAIEHIRQVTEELDPGYPADIRMFDDVLDDMYEKSHSQGMMVAMFSLIAIVLSLVGVFGLVIFEAQRRSKEIAVRKTFGATVSEILVMLNRGFIRIVGISFLVAAPCAWFTVSKWL